MATQHGRARVMYVATRRARMGLRSISLAPVLPLGECVGPGELGSHLGCAREGAKDVLGGVGLHSNEKKMKKIKWALEE